MPRIFLARSIAVGQKSGVHPSLYGQGFNYWVEVGFALDHLFQSSTCNEMLDQILSLIDHRALGVDVDLGLEPTSSALCTWIQSEFEKRGKAVTLRLIRGDGTRYAVPFPELYEI